MADDIKDNNSSPDQDGSLDELLRRAEEDADDREGVSEEEPAAEKPVGTAMSDEARAQAGHPPFRHVGEAPVERIRHNHAQHGIAQKLQPLVALAAGGAALVGEGAVRQRGLEKRPVAEMVAELFLKGFHQLPEACST